MIVNFKHWRKLTKSEKEAIGVCGCILEGPPQTQKQWKRFNQIQREKDKELNMKTKANSSKQNNNTNNSSNRETNMKTKQQKPTLSTADLKSKLKKATELKPTKRQYTHTEADPASAKLRPFFEAAKIVCLANAGKVKKDSQEVKDAIAKVKSGGYKIDASHISRTGYPVLVEKDGNPLEMLVPKPKGTKRVATVYLLWCGLFEANEAAWKSGTYKKVKTDEEIAEAVCAGNPRKSEVNKQVKLVRSRYVRGVPYKHGDGISNRYVRSNGHIFQVSTRGVVIATEKGYKGKVEVGARLADDGTVKEKQVAVKKDAPKATKKVAKKAETKTAKSSTKKGLKIRLKK